MPTRLLMLMIACWMAASSVVGQINAGAAPDASRAAATNAVNTNTVDSHPTAAQVAAPVANISVPPKASSTMLPAQTASQDQMKARKEPGMKPDCPSKNPYWEPRDWTYINNSAP
jgi:hypothetical protein